MALTIKFRFMRMLKKHQPMTRNEVTRRALGQFNAKANTKGTCDMPKLKRLIKILSKLELIKIETKKTEGRRGRVPDVFTVTDKGSGWVAEKEAKL